MKALFPYLLNLLITLIIAISSASLKAGPANSRVNLYLPKLIGKNVALVVNHSSMVTTKKGSVHLVDLLLSKDIAVKKLFALEHGVRGDADAGELVSDSRDSKSGLPIVSLYGRNKAPTQEHMQGIDTIVFDIQDVGVRFFTFISSLGLIMQSAAQAGVEVIVLDRPNPNSDYIAGPVLEDHQKSFVGAFPIPVVYGLTIGELALMIKDQKWQTHMEQLKLQVIPMKSFNRKNPSSLTFAPSPNLPSPLSVRLYPSLALFEPTIMSIGRGTNNPFTMIGAPDPLWGRDSFTPVSTPGAAKKPKHRDKRCFGKIFKTPSSQKELLKHQFNLEYLNAFIKKKNSIHNKDFFTSKAFFKLLLGTDNYKVTRKGLKFKRSFKRRNEYLLAKYKQMAKRYYLY